MHALAETTYFDYAATTPVDTRVLAAMLPYFDLEFGNTSSIHKIGQKAEAALEEAREQLSQGLNCHPNEVIFTSCGTESDNLALRGAAFAARNTRGANHILVSKGEHPAISRTAKQLQENFGFDVEFIPFDETGQVTASQVTPLLRPGTAVVSVIYANNEIGTINPIAEIGAVCRGKNIAFHTDAVQAAAYLPVDVEQLNVDMLSLGAHKFYGPKGIGALYVRRGTKLLPTLTGGGQENNLRAGTHNTPLIVGLAKAFQVTQDERLARTKHVLPLRDQIIGQVLEQIPDVQLTGNPSTRLPNHASFVFKGVDGNALLMLLDANGFACSSGSACKSGNPEPSSVLLAIGLERDWALGSLRVTLGISNTPQQVTAFLKTLPVLVQRSREDLVKKNNW